MSDFLANPVRDMQLYVDGWMGSWEKEFTLFAPSSESHPFRPGSFEWTFLFGLIFPKNPHDWNSLFGAS